MAIDTYERLAKHLDDLPGGSQGLRAVWKFAFSADSSPTRCPTCSSSNIDPEERGGCPPCKDPVEEATNGL